MNSKKESKRNKQKQQQNCFSPLPKRQNNDVDINPLNLRDFSPFRPIYGSHPVTTNPNFNFTQLTFIETPATKIQKPSYFEPFYEDYHRIQGILNWDKQSQEYQGNQYEDSQIIEMSQSESSKQEKRNTQQIPKKEESKQNNFNLRTAEPKQKKELQSQKKLSQTATTVSSSKKVTCNCKKTKCLKLYCDCFRINQTCDGCNCVGCHNITIYQDERNNAMLTLMDRNPEAFKPKIDQEQHAKGCHCRKSNCSKKYCECFQAGLRCGTNCKCEQCKNCEQGSEKNHQNYSQNLLKINFEHLLNEQKNQKEIQQRRRIKGSSSIRKEKKLIV